LRDTVTKSGKFDIGSYRVGQDQDGMKSTGTHDMPYAEKDRTWE